MKPILTQYDRELRIELEEPGVAKQRLPRLVRLVRPDPPMGLIRHSQLDPENADELIKEQVDYFSSKRMPFEWEVYDHDQPPDLEARLLSHGFKPDLDPEDPGPVLLLDLGSAALSPVPSSDAEVREIRDPDHLVDVAWIEGQVWGGDFAWLQERLAGHMRIPGYLSVFAAYVKDKPAACGWLYCYPHSQFAELRGGSTLRPLRRRGLYKALLEARVQRAAERGYTYLVVDAGPSSRPILEKYGFQLLTHARSYKWGLNG